MKTNEFSTEVLTLEFEVENRDDVPDQIKFHARRWFNNYDRDVIDYDVQEVSVRRPLKVEAHVLTVYDPTAKVKTPPNNTWAVTVKISRPLVINEKSSEYKVLTESKLVLE